MPLSAVDFVPLTGQIKAASHRQFFDLLTGTMTDQPVTLANTLQVGGSQGAGAAPIRINGVAAQTANMVEIRKLAADVQPLFVVGPTGTLAWGPGGAVGTDVTLARSLANQLTIQGLAGTPALVIPVGGLQVSSGNVGIGDVPLAQHGLRMPATLSLSAVAGATFGMIVSPTLVATANGDTLTGLTINPTFNDNAKTGVLHVGLRVLGGNVDFSGATVIPNLSTISIAPAAANINGGAGTWTDIPGSTTAIVAGTYLVILQLGSTTGPNADSPEIGLATSASSSGGSGLIVTSNQASTPGGAFGMASGVGVVALNGSYKLQVFSSTTTSTAIAKAVLVRIA